LADPAELLDAPPHALRNPCKGCGKSDGALKPTGFQDCVYCRHCGLFQYNAPRTETGREKLTTRTAHNISPSQRSRVLMRAHGMCELCSNHRPLQVSHILPVVEALEQGLQPVQFNDDDNLLACCAECNLGMGKNPVPLWLVMGLLVARAKRGQEKA
jgi:hypothetical protein